MKLKTLLIAIFGIVLLLSILSGCEKGVIPGGVIPEKTILPRFESEEAFVKAFSDYQEKSGAYYGRGDVAVSAMAESAPSSSGAETSFSKTNVQVEGVDEADIIKTDGDYIYAVANGNLIIARAYPASRAEILSTTKFNNFYPQEIFIHNNRLVLFGSSNYNFPAVEEPQPVPVGAPTEPSKQVLLPETNYYPNYIQTMSVKLYDLSDKEDPNLIRTIDFEGSYLTSRKIDENVYFVVNSYPNYYVQNPGCNDIVPLYREGKTAPSAVKEFAPIAPCTEIGYIEPIQAYNFITIASISMEDEDKPIEKETIVGSGQNVYASLDNIYIAQTNYPTYYMRVGEIAEDFTEKTVITKFALDNGKINYAGRGEVKGHILNQFSMDEFEDNFRIATTIGQVSRTGGSSTNNIYVLDDDLTVIGELEDLAPGEKIYSARFMGEKAYLVTFKKVDPLFVIDLSNPRNPSVLGKLKIPGYSDYLHPYDENHIIGIGKEAVEAEEGDFAWYQGIKIAIFDVSDVENPIELHKVVIGDRGTDSPLLYDHKALLFDKERNLFVIPVTVAEIKGEPSSANQYGDFVFQGAYVYDINLDDGFKLRGRITHYDDQEIFQKSGYYFYGNAQITRSLFIDDVLYTFSNARLQLNKLDSLERIKMLEFEQQEYPVVVGEVIV